ncbi:EGF-like and EMI domain-containing protein 1 [Macaca thibetana thibetana]|uniref:EGF-like and EMI domain-containing protein 1 n=1 Tax=Macaca thibetana thibetana TaxID=257877 RepID=UPI0021BC6216|nr:EGF-like and EMI domain-containing protein 1 [Macaca thibetana thibetana]
MSSRLCFCVWAVAGWPPGSALQLRLGMPSVCEEQQVTVVELAHPYVRAFTDIVKLWKQGCTGSSWCVSYERRLMEMKKEVICEVTGSEKNVNECTIDNGGCQDRCCNTVGSYYCKCQADQKLEEDGKGCEDVDECAVVNGGCQQRCINTLGTFHWECDTGWRLHADECTCINE